MELKLTVDNSPKHLARNYSLIKITMTQIQPENLGQNSTPTFGNEAKTSEGFGTIPQSSASFGSVPNASESFRTIPQASESFRMVPNHAERSENHVLTVRDATRLFEAAGVARTERSIVNWCQPNKMGVTRLECYFDPNDRKYFITPQSVESAIAEEKAKADRTKGESSEAFGTNPNTAEAASTAKLPPTTGESADIKAMQAEIMDLKITNKVKDQVIEHLKKEYDKFSDERQGYIDKLIGASRRIGEMTASLLHLGQPQPPAVPFAVSDSDSRAAVPTLEDYEREQR